MRKGLFKAADLLLEQQVQRKIRVKENLEKTISTINKDFETLLNKFSFDHSEYQV